ncbi:uncharacterized protein [Nicotiana tomentosiformis]|uniref:uncharacterized protein n=1 Tax=Nicotiana tomentosiformis TaxID=4098 RepID=UPI00388C8846
MRTSTWATPYMLVYGTEAVIPAEVEIPSLRVIQEAKLDDAEWIRFRKVKSRQFTPGQLVLKKIFPHQEEDKRKFVPNWTGLYVVYRVLSGGELTLTGMDGKVSTKPIKMQSRDITSKDNIISFIVTELRLT